MGPTEDSANDEIVVPDVDKATVHDCATSDDKITTSVPPSTNFSTVGTTDHTVIDIASKNLGLRLDVMIMLALLTESYRKSCPHSLNKHHLFFVERAF